MGLPHLLDKKKLRKRSRQLLIGKSSTLYRLFRLRAKSHALYSSKLEAKRRTRMLR